MSLIINPLQQFFEWDFTKPNLVKINPFDENFYSGTEFAAKFQQTESGLEGEFEMPGLMKEEIKVSYDSKSNNFLITGETKDPKRKFRSYIFSEIVRDVNPDTIEAKYENGILFVICNRYEKSSTSKTVVVK